MPQTNIEVYEVGGSVRDRILGLRSKDLDYTVLAPSFEAMCWYVENVIGAKIVVFKPEFLTIRAVHPVLGGVDYVMSRKDGAYSDGRRPDEVVPGNLYDDLARRDFTMNAIATLVGGNGELIDPFGGCNDIEDRVIRCVGNTDNRMFEDSLRMIRALRFSVTKKFVIHPDITRLFNDAFWVDRVANASADRIRDEVGKMFRFSTPDSIRAFAPYPALMDACFSNTGVWLEATSKSQ